MAQLKIASQINDEEILLSLMQSYIEIAKVNYDYLEGYIQDIGQLTVNFINSDQEEVAI